jgi:hypothetical protein
VHLAPRDVFQSLWLSSLIIGQARRRGIVDHRPRVRGAGNRTTVSIPGYACTRRSSAETQGAPIEAILCIFHCNGRSHLSCCHTARSELREWVLSIERASFDHHRVGGSRVRSRRTPMPPQTFEFGEERRCRHGRDLELGEPPASLPCARSRRLKVENTSSMMAAACLAERGELRARPESRQERSFQRRSQRAGSPLTPDISLPRNEPPLRGQRRH